MHFGLRACALALAVVVFAPVATLAPARANDAVKFVLPWDFESGTAPWPAAAADGCFTRNGLDVTIDRGFGSGDALTKVASGAYQIGVADLGTLINFNAQHPDQKMIASFITNDRAPLSIVALKKSGITKPSDLVGKKLGDAVGEASRLMFPALAKADGFSDKSVNWVSVTTNLREAALLRGEFDAAAGDDYTIVTNLHRVGVKDSDITVMPYNQFGLDVIGRAVVTKPAWAAAHPEIMRKFISCTALGIRDSVLQPVAAIEAVKKYNALLDTASGVEGLNYINRVAVATPYTKRAGFGNVELTRLERMLAYVSELFNIPKPAVSDVWTGAYLPPANERMLTPK